MLYFVLCVIAVKTFVSLSAVYHFHRVLDVEDWMHTYTPDLAVGFNAAMFLSLGVLILWFSSGRENLRRICNILLLFQVATALDVSMVKSRGAPHWTNFYFIFYGAILWNVV